MAVNPTGRHIGPPMMKKLPKIILRAGKVFMAAFAITLYGCGNGSGTEGRFYRSPFDALEDYSSCLHRMSSYDKADMKLLTDLVRDWKNLDDSIYSRFFPEPYGEGANRSDSSYLCIRDSIVSQLCSLAESDRRTLSDYITLVAAVRRTPRDYMTVELVSSLHRFFGSMDATPTFGIDAGETVRRYEALLDSALADGFSSKEDLFDFLRDEDMAFRSFLEHLPDLGNIPLAGIRDNSIGVMRQMVTLASEDDGVFAPSELLTILIMRNNRRLIQNVLQCVNNIRAGKVGNDERNEAYLWMLLQPWLTFDAGAYSLMSGAQMRTMGILAAETPKCVERLGKPEFPVDTDSLPVLLIGTLISTL